MPSPRLQGITVMRNRKSFKELSRLKTFKERFEYLKLDGRVGEDTFGWDRCLNQALYTSQEWRNFRTKIIVRDNGFDMGLEDHPIGGKIILHHLNPITEHDLVNRADSLFDPDNVVCVSMLTHNAIHYGSYDLLSQNEFQERQPNDTCPWKA